ncbi:helix-turn-helix domain-containing protein [Lentzea sp. NPDC005914]|uniref:helix-turn-helix domain-containing protein n=1 Tax=Lentzea sp. NPDC005914 TaxID=3154572 RepID=UPI003403D0A9
MSSVHTIRETAWVLGISQGLVFRAIRLGLLTAERQYGRLVVSDSSLRRVLSEPGVLRD